MNEPHPPAGAPAGDMLENRTFDEIRVGDETEMTHVLSAQDIELCNLVSGGQPSPSLSPEPLRSHDPMAGSNAVLGASLAAAVVDQQLPGPGAACLRMQFEFLGPMHAGDSIVTHLRVKARHPRDGTVDMECTARNQHDAPVLQGTLRVRAPREKLRRPRLEPPQVHLRRHAHFRALLAEAGRGEALTTAVAHPCSPHALHATLQAAEAGLIVPILVGPRARIEQTAVAAGVSLEGLRIVDAPHSEAAARAAVALVRSGEAALLMKGSLHTDELLHAVLDPVSGLRTGRRLSHVYLMDVPGYPRPLLITDAVVNIAPNLMHKRDIVQNAIDLARVMGIERPRVAILSAVETVNPKLGSTLDAAALCKMADRGQIHGGEVDGPLAFDNAVSPEAAAEKGIVSDVAGRADILVAPDLVAGNMLAKQLSFMAGADAAGVVLGARVPIILTSRADAERVRLASCAVALLMTRDLAAARGTGV